MKTFASVLKENRNVGPGFDFMRVVTALSIVYLHSWTVCAQYFAPYNWDNTPVWMLHFIVVPVFFAISGFLTTASAERLTLKNFAINRAMRIIPALSSVTLLCALVIGPIFTTLTLRDYFLSTEFEKYFLNVFGWVHYYLPGVFSTHSVAAVNGSLWTVPFEFGCYTLIAGLMVLRILKSKVAVLSMVLIYMLLSVLVGATGLDSHTQWHGIREVAYVAFIDHEASAITAFLLGIVAYQFRERIPYSRLLFASSIILLLVIAFAFPTMQAALTPILRFLLLPAIVYGTVFIGLTKMPLPKFFKTGDYSYGIYLYHQPFLQILVALFPALALAPHTGPLFTFFVGVPLSICAAWLSWHLLEKRMLALRKRFSIVAKERGVAQPASASVPDAATAN